MATFFCTAPTVGIPNAEPALRVFDRAGEAEPIQLDGWFPTTLPEAPEEEEALVRQLTPLILKLVRSYRPKRESEEDLVQMVLIKVFRKFSQYSGEVPLVHWVSRIAINTCLNQCAREKCRPELRHADLSEEEAARLDYAAHSETDCTPAETLEKNELAESLLSTLPARDRRILELLHLSRYSLEETSTLTGLSVGAVKVRAFRARARLRKTLPRLLRSATS